MDYLEEYERAPSIWLKGVERMNTFQILREVDKLMAHNPDWKPFVNKYRGIQLKSKGKRVNCGSCAI